MGITVKDLQNSLRLDSDTDNDLLQRYINTAESYVKNAVDSNVSLTTYRTLDEFNSAVALFAEFLYQSRGQAGKIAEARPFEINALIGQLQAMDLPENLSESKSDEGINTPEK